MYRYFLFFIFLPALFLISQEISEQKDVVYLKSRYGFEVQRPPVVSFSSYSDIYKDSVLTISVSVQNDYLQFTRKDDIFYAQYEIIASLRDQDDKAIISDVWQKTVNVLDFDETNSKELFQSSVHSIPLTRQSIAQIRNKNNYLIVELRDLLSSRLYKAKRKIKAPLDEEFSNIMFLSFTTEGTEIISTNNVLSFNQPYSVKGYFLKGEHWLGEENKFNIRIFKKESDENILIKQDFISGAKITENIVSYKYQLPRDLLEEGEYGIRISHELKDKIYSYDEKFKVVWFEKPTYLYKTDLAIRPMKYLLTDQEMEYVKELDLEKLQDWFSDYWKEKDPSPETAYNELKDEFFNRVSYTVRKFSTRFKEGWQTDQGMVYILYGKPGVVENKKYRSDLPYIVWTYGTGSDKTVFTFVDDDLNGEFTLVEDENDGE